MGIPLAINPTIINSLVIILSNILGKASFSNLINSASVPNLMNNILNLFITLRPKVLDLLVFANKLNTRLSNTLK